MELSSFLLDIKFFDIKVINWEDFFQLLMRFSLNLGVSLLLVRVLYYQATKRKDYLFTFLLISTTVFLLCFLLESVKLEIGFALGLFAVFGIIRYRTTQIPIKEMTYLFILIALSVINALSSKKVSYAELTLTNFIIVAIAYGLERVWLLKHESSKLVIYEKIELIKPEHQTELLDDLRARTGLPIHRIEIGKINFLRDTAQVIIYYYADSEANVSFDDLNNNDDDGI